jgi:flavin reductase (DIM6/NTAB) family NADH-FMN oxidoreductase RutF
LQKNVNFSLTFFDEKYRKALNICGTKSGRDTDKVREAGLTPRTSKSGLVYFEEAKLVIECTKLYFHDITPENILLPSINNLYNNDYHRMYIGEITGIMKK